MNTGIQDAHNLAWKIALSMKGIAHPSLLHTYETERKPIAILNTALSVQNFRAAMAVPAALGIDPTVANSVYQVFTDGVGSLLPSRLQSIILQGLFAIGRAQLSESFLTEKNPLGSSRLVKLRHIFEEGNSLQLQFPAEDLGFRYREGALVSDSDTVASVPKPPTGRRRDYVPSADPGSRLPHMDVRLLSNLSSKVTISTHDLLSGDKIEFLMIIAPMEASYRLARAAFRVAKEFRVCARVCIMWPVDTTVDGARKRSEEALAPWEKYIDVVEVRKSSHVLSWWSLCQMTEKGAILVRPDEHIGWRTESVFMADPISEMKMVFSAIMAMK